MTEANEAKDEAKQRYEDYAQGTGIVFLFGLFLVGIGLWLEVGLARSMSTVGLILVLAALIGMVLNELGRILGR